MDVASAIAAPGSPGVVVNLRSGWQVRVLAVATAGYSAVMTVRPAVLATPCGLTDADGSVPPAIAGLIRSIGVRDAALALVLAASPTGPMMRLLTAARVVSDGTDAVWFSRIAPRSQVAKISGVATAWATLEALALGVVEARA